MFRAIILAETLLLIPALMPAVASAQSGEQGIAIFNETPKAIRRTPLTILALLLRKSHWLSEIRTTRMRLYEIRLMMLKTSALS